jgi:HEAT repeat protein
VAFRINAKWIAPVLLGVVVLGAAVVFLDPTFTLLGVLEREPFYRGRSALYWRGQLLDHDPAVQGGAMSAIREGGAEAVPLLVHFLRASRPIRSEHTGDWVDDDLRQRSAGLLGQIGPDARDSVPELTALLPDHNARLRETAAASLGQIGHASAEAVPGLVGLLNDPEVKVRRAAVRALGRIGPAAKEALPGLARLRSDPDEEVRREAERAAALIEAPATEKGS